MTNFRKLLMVGAAVGALSASPAMATVITQSATVGGGQPLVTTDLAGVSFSNSLSLFDASAIAAANAGNTVHLNSVTLTYVPVVNTIGTVTNTAAQAQTFSFRLILDSYLGAGTQTNAAAAQGIVLSNFGFGTAGDLDADFGKVTYTLLAPATPTGYPNSNPGGTTLTGNGVKLLTDNSSLSAFTGTGSFALTDSTGTSQTFTGGGGNTAATLSTHAGATFTVAYDYTLTPIEVPPTGVPEPTSMAILGAGLLGLGLIRRKKA